MSEPSPELVAANPDIAPELLRGSPDDPDGIRMTLPDGTVWEVIPAPAFASDLEADEA